eukprot:11189315-Lingulodinium_polyedra.AAC.1
MRPLPSEQDHRCDGHHEVNALEADVGVLAEKLPRNWPSLHQGLLLRLHPRRPVERRLRRHPD